MVQSRLLACAVALATVLAASVGVAVTTTASAGAASVLTNKFTDKAKDAPAGFDLTSGVVRRSHSAFSFSVRVRKLGNAGAVLVGAYNAKAGRRGQHVVFEVDRHLDGPGMEVLIGRGPGKLSVDQNGRIEGALSSAGYVSCPSARITWSRAKHLVRTSVPYSCSYGVLYPHLTTVQDKSFSPRQVATMNTSAVDMDTHGKAHGSPLS